MSPESTGASVVEMSTPASQAPPSINAILKAQRRQVMTAANPNSGFPNYSHLVNQCKNWVTNLEIVLGYVYPTPLAKAEKIKSVLLQMASEIPPTFLGNSRLPMTVESVRASVHVMKSIEEVLNLPNIKSQSTPYFRGDILAGIYTQLAKMVVHSYFTFDAPYSNLACNYLTPCSDYSAQRVDPLLTLAQSFLNVAHYGVTFSGFPEVALAVTHSLVEASKFVLTQTFLAQHLACLFFEMDEFQNYIEQIDLNAFNGDQLSKYLKNEITRISVRIKSPWCHNAHNPWQNNHPNNFNSGY